MKKTKSTFLFFLLVLYFNPYAYGSLEQEVETFFKRFFNFDLCESLVPERSLPPTNSLIEQKTDVTHIQTGIPLITKEEVKTEDKVLPVDPAKKSDCKAGPIPATQVKSLRRPSTFEVVEYEKLEKRPRIKSFLSQYPGAIEFYGLLDLNINRLLEVSHHHTHGKVQLEHHQSLKADAVSACGKTAELGLSFIPFIGKVLATASRISSEKVSSHITEKLDQSDLERFAQLSDYVWSRDEINLFSHEVALHTVLMLLRDLAPAANCQPGFYFKLQELPEYVNIIREAIFKELGRTLKSKLLRSPINSSQPLSLILAHKASNAVKAKILSSKSRSLLSQGKIQSSITQFKIFSGGALKILESLLGD